MSSTVARTSASSAMSAALSSSRLRFAAEPRRTSTPSIMATALTTAACACPTSAAADALRDSQAARSAVSAALDHRAPASAGESGVSITSFARLASVSARLAAA
eukprot:5594134-Prymnesium_polylepis.2